MALSKLTSSDAEALAREKINAALDALDAAEVDADAISQRTGAVEADLAALQVQLAPYVDLVGSAPDRPGDGRTLFTRDMTGDPKSRPPIDRGTVADGGELGQVLRISGTDVDPVTGYIDVAPRRVYFMQPGRTYLVQHAYARHQDTLDGLNHAVEVRFQTLRSDYQAIETVFLGGPNAPKKADGAYFVDTFVGKKGCPGTVSYIVPDRAAYGVPFFRIYGNGHQTDLGAVRLYDVTFALAGGADVASILGQVASLNRLIQTKAALSEVTAITDPMKARLDTLESAQKNGRITRATYAELSQITLDPLFTYEVPFEDTGTHPGGVGEVGYLNGRVPNSGIFIAVGNAPYTLKRVSGTRMADQAFGEPGIFAWSVDNLRGETGFAIDREGNILNEGFEKLLKLVSLIGDPGIFAWAVRNKAGEIGFAVDNEGKILNEGYEALVDRVEALSGGGTGPTAPGTSFPLVEAYRSLSFPAENIHIPMTGQSQIVGVGGNPPLSITPVAGVLSFNGGVRSQDTSEDPAVSRTSLVPLIETREGPKGETPASGMAKMLLQLLKAENGIDLNAQGQRLIISAPGQSGVRLDQIMTGTLLARAYNDIDYAVSLSKAAGRSCNSPLSVMNHGGADIVAGTSRADYRQMAVDYQNLLKDRARAASKVPAEMPFFIFQHAGYTYYNNPLPDIALEQAAMCRDLPYWIMVGPDYIFPRIDGIHYFNTGHLLAGAYFGRAIKRVMWDHTYAPSLSVKSIVREDNRAIVEFNVPFGPLVIDRKAISDPGRAGFTLVRADGSTINQSKDPYVYGGNKLVLTIGSTSTVPAGAKVRGGWAQTTGQVDAGPTTGPRTCLRDSDPMLFDPTGYRLPMHNYCPIFEQEALSR